MPTGPPRCLRRETRLARPKSPSLLAALILDATSGSCRATRTLENQDLQRAYLRETCHPLPLQAPRELAIVEHHPENTDLRLHSSRTLRLMHDSNMLLTVSVANPQWLTAASTFMNSMHKQSRSLLSFCTSKNILVDEATAFKMFVVV